jgi:1-acyl-sn-glycerol-3-phosphate acyltransferase
MIYIILKGIVRLAFIVFFRKKRISGRRNIPTKGPLIIAVNHPNTLIDPLLIGSQIKRRVGFLANASLFINNAVNSFFNYLWVIPVYRKEDVKEGEIQNNASSFRKCYDFFDKGRALLIFPEGTSVNELKLRDIKTGTARIALGYESKNNFPGTLRINTVAINYSDSLRFRSMVSIYINKPFYVKEYQTLWEEDNELAIRELTARIRDEIGGQITLTDNKEQELTVLQAQKFYLEYIDPSISRYVDPNASFELRKLLAIKIRKLEEQDHSYYKDIADKLRTYFSNLQNLKLTPGFLRPAFLDKNEFFVLLSYITQLVLFLPFYILGIITNYIPYKIPAWIFTALKPEVEYKSSISVLVGLIVFPLYYFLMLFLFRTYITDDIFWSILFLISLPFLGFTTLFYWKIVKRFLRLFRFYFKINKETKISLVEERDELYLLLNKMQ